MLVAPQSTAVRMCRSETALQTQMIMGAILNANANDCQYRACEPHPSGLKQRLSMRPPPMHNACCPFVTVR
jgi:hypothetical protein